MANFRSRTAWFAGCAVIAVATAAAADEAPPVSDEVVVTAMKREENLQDVGATVTALPAEALRRSRIGDLADLASYAPNVDIKETVPGALPTVTIRGIGLDDFSSTSSPAAGVYVDEVPLASPALMSGALFDLQRIETLKGPQGTLYGHNTTAGALNIISARPGRDFDASARAGYGAYKTFEAEGMLNIASEKAQARFSAKTIQQGEGFWTSTLQANGTPGERDIGRRDIWLGRAQVAFQPTEGLDILFKLEGERSRSEIGVPQAHGSFGVGTPFVPCAPVLAGRLDNTQCADAYGYRNLHSDPYKGDWVGDFPYNIDQLAATARVRWQVGDYELTSITGYVDFSRLYHIDVDATPRRQFDFIEDEDVTQATQEFRIARAGERADVIAGAFFSWDSVKGDNTNVLDQWPLLLFGAASGSGKTTYDQTTRSAAVYANATWHLTSATDLVTGLRYTGEKRHYRGGTSFITPSPAVGIFPTFIDQGIRDTNLTWTLGLNHHLTDDVLLYASASRGVKSGGFFSGFTNSNVQLIPYRPEQLTAYEVGAKTRFGRTLTLNAALFYYDYKDPQTFIRFVDPLTTLSVQKVGNVDSARSYGLDLDMVWRPVDGLTLTGGLGLLNTRLSSFTTTGGVVPAGNRLPNAPEVSFNGSARYEWSLTAALKASVQGEAHYSAEVFKEAANDPLIKADAYWLFNARAAVTTDDGRWELALWGKNLSDELYIVQGNDLASLGSVNLNYNAPRTFGVELTWRY